MLRDQPALPRQTRAPLPRIWLFTDERNDPGLARSIARLPRGSGIIFRHHHLKEPARQHKFESVRKLARRHGHIILLAGTPDLARRWRANGVHRRSMRRARNTRLLHSAPVHNAREIREANHAGADIFFLSPVCATRSHPGQRPLHPIQVRRLAASCKGLVILLGGMTRVRYRAYDNCLTHGWAGIDAFE